MNWAIAFVIAAFILAILAAVGRFWEKAEGTNWPRLTLLCISLACYFASILAGHLLAK